MHEIVEHWHKISIAFESFSLNFDRIGQGIFSKSRRKRLISCISVVQMTANLTDVRQNNSACVACDSYNDNLVNHFIHECSSLVVDRAKLWHDISCLSMNAYTFLNTQKKNNVVLSMANTDLSDVLCDEQDNFKF